MCRFALAGGRDNLPQIAFNVRDRRVLPYDSAQPVTLQSLRRFVRRFLAGALEDAAERGAAAPKRAAREEVRVVLAGVSGLCDHGWVLCMHTANGGVRTVS